MGAVPRYSSLSRPLVLLPERLSPESPRWDFIFYFFGRVGLFHQLIRPDLLKLTTVLNEGRMGRPIFRRCLPAGGATCKLPRCLSVSDPCSILISYVT